MSFSGWHHIQVEMIVRETAMAFLFQIDGEEVWIPKACVADAKDYSEGDEDLEVSIRESILEEKVLI